MKKVCYLKDLDEIEALKSRRINTLVNFYEETLSYLKDMPLSRKTEDYEIRRRAEAVLEELKISDEMYLEDK
jgi:hypothetical protein